MSLDDRLRSAIDHRTSSVEPRPDGLTRIEEKLMEAQRSDNRNRILLGVAAAIALVALVVGVLALSDDDDPQVDTVDAPTTTTTAPEDTTTTTVAETTTTSIFAPTVDPTLPIFPDPSTARRFDAPEPLVSAFVGEVVGMTSPIVGPFAAGDSRSGEIEVRAFEQGAPTTVLVRQLEDDTWFVIGAATESIQPEEPAALDRVTSPQPLTGSAYAFEGTVHVQIFADGTEEPVGSAFVTGRGDGVLGGYEGQIEFEAPDTGNPYGWLLYTSEGGEDGAPIQFAAVRVAL
jgi:hypothetical protein